MRVVIVKPYYDWDGRKYIEVSCDNSQFRIKIPFRYGRAMYHTNGLKTIHEMKQGDILDVIIQKKVWDGTEFWVLHSFEEIIQTNN
jgi:hypothetical protein